MSGTATVTGVRPGVRQATLALHIASAGAWIGVDSVVAVLMLTGC